MADAPVPVQIATRDGQCRSFVFTPEGAGPWPAVIVYMDTFGVRPALFDLARRVAALGYYVLVPDLFYRSGAYAAMEPAEFFAAPEKFKMLREKFSSKANVANVMADTEALLDFLDRQADVKPGPVGVTGYCMGGRLALAVAGTFGARIAAAAIFHAGGLAGNEADSPHRLAHNIKARVFVAGATGDHSFPDSMKAALEKALDDAGVEHTVETWPGKHGWTFSDTPVYDEACYERHFGVLKDLFGQTLGR